MPDFTACISIGRDGAFFWVYSMLQYWLLWCVFLGLFADVDLKVIGAVADEAVGPVANVQYKQLMEKFGGTQKNRVFSFFEIVLPCREAGALLAEAEEKKQQKVAGGTTSEIRLLIHF